MLGLLAVAVLLIACSNGEVLEFTVGPELQDCTGSFPTQCMVVDDGLFYDPIEGFDYQEGYTYELKVERYDKWDGEPPQDAGKYGYRLVEVVSKTAQAPSSPGLIIGLEPLAACTDKDEEYWRTHEWPIMTPELLECIKREMNVK